MLTCSEVDTSWTTSLKRGFCLIEGGREGERESTYHYSQDMEDILLIEVVVL